jgi:hypothetical protein
MPKVVGNLRITTVAGSQGVRPHFELMFVPYAGRMATKSAAVNTYDDLVAFLIDLKFSEDESTRWAGKARSQGIILIDSFERPDALLREKGLLA